MMTEEEERELTDLAIKAKFGDSLATEELCKANRVYISQYFRVYFFYDFNDFLQDCLIKLVQSLNKFDINRGFAQWRHRLVFNEMIDRKRREKSHLNFMNNLAVQEEKSNEYHTSNFDKKVYKQTIFELLKVLNPRNRAIIQKKYLEEKANKIIIKELKINPASIGIRIQRALAKMRQTLTVAGISKEMMF
jgi:RNA polymerase sigma factor (sigma-70 family)